MGACARLLWRLFNLGKEIRPDRIHIQGRRLYRTATFVSRLGIDSTLAIASFEAVRCTWLCIHYWRAVQRMYSAPSHPHTHPLFKEARTKQWPHVITLGVQLWANIDSLWKIHHLRPRHRPKILWPIVRECSRIGKPWKMIFKGPFSLVLPADKIQIISFNVNSSVSNCDVETVCKP